MNRRQRRQTARAAKNRRTGDGAALHKTGERENAIAAVRHAIAVQPSFAHAHYNLGQILYRETELAPAADALTEALRRDPVLFMNVDCDLYGSTKTVFECPADRIVPGTIIVFDEYLIDARWRDDEYKAFQEAVNRYSWDYEYIAFNLFSKQAAVKIL